MEYNLELLDEIIRNRRSIKPAQYNGEPVDDKIIHAMLENARWAPTHGLTEPWRFFIYSNEGKNKLADFQSELYKQVTAPEVFTDAKRQSILSATLKSSHVILIGMKRQEIKKIPEWEEISAVACSIQNIQLTAAAYGVGCYWSTGGLSQRDQMKDFLGMNAEDKCMGILYIGNYDGHKPVATRTPIKEKSVWITS